MLAPGALEGFRFLNLLDGLGADTPRLLRGPGADVVTLQRSAGAAHRRLIAFEMGSAPAADRHHDRRLRMQFAARLVDGM